MPNYTIVEARDPIVAGLAGHDMVVLLNDQGQVVEEIDGLATSANGDIKEVGYLPSDKLYAYGFDKATYYDSTENQAVIASGDATTMTNMFQAAVDAGNAINQLGLSYPFLGLGSNSNSVASTLVRAMGVDEPNLGNAIAPGVGTILLPEATITQIQNQNGLTDNSQSYEDQEFLNTILGGTGGYSQSVTTQAADGTSATYSLGGTQAANETSSVAYKNATGNPTFSETNSVASDGTTVADASGSGGQVNVGTNSTVNITGNNNTISGANSDVINVQTDASSGNNANADSVFMSNGTVSLDTSNSSVTITGSENVAQDTPGVSGGIVTFDSGPNFADIANGQVDVGGDNQTVVVDGTNDTVYGGSYTGVGFNLGSDQTDYIYGSNEIIFGQNGDSIVDYGNNNTIDANGSTVTDEGNGDITDGNNDTVYGNGTGDGVMGTSDVGGTGYTGGGPTGGTGGTGGTTYYGSSGFDSGSRQGKVNTVSSYDLAHGFTKAANAADAAWARTSKVIEVATMSGAVASSALATMPEALASSAATNAPGAVAPSALATARWGSSTVTWSFSGGPTSGADPISGAIQAQYQAAVEQAFKTWAAASGITFNEVTAGAKSDITVGWGALGTSVSGLLGYTAATTRSGILQPGATIRLEDPSEDALIGNANGSYTYSGTTTTLEQLVLHEIGHTLGLAESSNLNSIMFPELSASNTGLDASDIQNIGILYPQTSSAAGTGTMAMAQAMASFSAPAPAATTTNAHEYARTFAPAIAIPLA